MAKGWRESVCYNVEDKVNFFSAVLGLMPAGGVL